MAMDYRDLIPFFPEGTVKVLDNKGDWERAKAEVAKEHNKKVEDLTEREKKEALGKMGLCELDLQIP